MFVSCEGEKLKFFQIPLSINKTDLSNVFASKNNKTLAETLSSRRYAGLADESIRYYSESLNTNLGDFLVELKTKGDEFYLRFLNPYGDHTFCDFSVSSTALTKAKGIYCFVFNGEICYIGRSHDPFEKRVNQGYGQISPKNCYKDGQSTNCRINSLIAKHFAGISLFVHPLEDDLKIDRLERELLSCLTPKWNIQK